MPRREDLADFAGFAAARREAGRDAREVRAAGGMARTLVGGADAGDELVGTREEPRSIALPSWSLGRPRALDRCRYPSRMQPVVDGRPRAECRAASRALGWDLDPCEAILAWPAEVPLGLVATDDQAGDGARWTLLMPVDSPRRIAPRAPLADDPDATMRSLAALLCDSPLSRAEACPSDSPPFSLGQVVALSYELGRRLEPSVVQDALRLAAMPDAWAVRPPWLLVHDRRRDGWWWIAAEGAEAPDWVEGLPHRPRAVRSFALEPLRADLPARAFERAVAATVDLIHAGDLFQANVAQRFSTTLDGSPRSLAAAALRGHSARHGAYLELDGDHAVLSMSPESFLHVEAGGVVSTRPIKGTRPGDGDPAELLASAKDAAELAMIVDLMRNDLGRACRLGSVEVREPRRLERHPTVIHAVAEVRGRLRSEVTTAELLAATFPPGSVTGAPKIRAMQVIESLEPVPRGIYCGSIGWIDDRHGLRLNVAIRTAMLARIAEDRWTLGYHAGCGIVAESEPLAETAESLAKTAVLARLTR